MNEEKLAKLISFTAGVVVTLAVWAVATALGWRPTL